MPATYRADDEPLVRDLDRIEWLQDGNGLQGDKALNASQSAICLGNLRKIDRGNVQETRVLPVSAGMTHSQSFPQAQ